MQALSIQQPWAELIVSGVKDIENRSWATNVRGEIFVHAGKKFDMQSFLELQAEGHFPGMTQKDFKLGGIVGKTTIVDCVIESESEWFYGEYGFVLENSSRLQFIPFRGQLKFFDVPVSDPSLLI